MRTLITGGTGLIGRALAAALAARGEEAVVLTRDPEKAAKGAPLPKGVRAERWDGETAKGWGDLVDGETAIVHLAGEGIADGRWSDERKRRIRASRVGSGKAVLAAIREAGEKGRAPRVLLQASAVGYYGDGGDGVLTEASPPGRGFLADVCVEWEDSTKGAEGLGVRRALLRTGIVLDREGGALPRMALPFRLMVGGPIGSGRQWFPWIHQADEVAAILYLLDHPEASGPYNLTAPHPVTNRDLSRTLARALRRPSPMIPAPAFALRLALGEMADALLVGQRAVPRRLLDAGFEFRFATIDAALRDLLD